MNDLSTHQFDREPQFDVHQILPSLVSKDSDTHLVMIHGIADSSSIWRSVCKLLDTRFRTYQELDMQWSFPVGSMATYKPTPESNLRDAWNLLPDGRKVVFAHSYGANVLLSLLSEERPTDIDALVLVSVYGKSSPTDFTWEMFHRYVDEFDRFLDMSIDSNVGTEKLSDSSRTLILDRLRDNYSPCSWLQFFMTFSQTPKLKLSNIGIPVLIIGGHKDFSIEYEDMKQFTKRFPNGELCYLENCGHFAMREDPFATATQIDQYLKSRNIR